MKTVNVVFAIAFALGLASTVAANASLVTAPQVLTSKLI
jgi:formate/nitrite transporter FocA (FNT family)